MSGQDVESRGPSAGPVGSSLHRGPADVAYRRAWWSLALYPPAIVGATIGIGFVGLNLLSYVVGLVFG